MIKVSILLDILQNCDLLICIGTRMAYPQVGYNIEELARDAKIIAVEISEQEINKFFLKYKKKVPKSANEIYKLNNLVRLKTNLLSV